MKKAIIRLITVAFLVGFMTVPVWAVVEIEPSVVEIVGHRKRFDAPTVDAIQRYLLIDVSPVDVSPVDEEGHEGDGIPDIDPIAVLMLFPGGSGKLRLEPGDSNTGSANFVVRTRYQFAAEGFVVAVIDAASDFLEHSHGRRRTDGFRHRSGLRGHRFPSRPPSLLGDKYKIDLQAVTDDLRIRFPGLPVWAVGTSRGTNSAAVAAAELDNPPDGIVLTSSLTGPSRDGDLDEVDLGKVEVPTLIVTNQDDECSATKPEDSKRLKKRFTMSPRVQVLIFKGGSTPLSDGCGGLSGHGFLGIEQKVIDAIARWIKHAEQ